MKIKADLLRVRSLPYDDKGNKIEPEQQPVQRIFKTESDAGLQGGPNIGKIPTEIIYETNVGAMAGAMRNPCFSCVAEGTVIVTEYGAIPIEAAAQAKRTFVDGSWRDIAMWAETGVKETLEITTTHGGKMVVTPEHRVMTERGWLAAADLRHEFRPGGIKDNRDLLVALGQSEFGSKDLISRDDALLLGVLVGDGWVYRRHGEVLGLALSWCIEMETALEGVVSHGGERFGSTETVHMFGEGRKNDFTEYARPMRRIFWRNAEARRFAALVDKQHVPSVIWRSTPECAAAYLRGLFTTDGSITTNPRPAAKFYQTSESLIEDVRLLLRSLGIHSTVHREVRAPKYKDLFQITVARHDSLERFLQFIGFLDVERMLPLTKAVADRRGKAKMSPERVRSIREVGMRRVFDISVPDTESFYANGLKVHNCKHFDRRAWRQLLARWNDPLTPIAERQELNGVRAALLGTKNAKIQEKHVSQEGDMDVEHALSTLGICHAFTELNSNVLIVYPTATCPETVCSPTQPNGFYVAKDRDSEKMGSTVFDRVMRLATGKAL